MTLEPTFHKSFKINERAIVVPGGCLTSLEAQNTDYTLDPTIDDLDECLECGVWALASEVFGGMCDACKENGNE